MITLADFRDRKRGLYYLLIRESRRLAVAAADFFYVLRLTTAANDACYRAQSLSSERTLITVRPDDIAGSHASHISSLVGPAVAALL